MTRSELFQLLSSTGLSVSYRQFPKERPQAPPFIIYAEAFSRNLIADGRNIFKVVHYQIELYTTTKDPVSEAKIEAALNAARIPYQTFEADIPSENLLQVVYTVAIPGA